MDKKREGTPCHDCIYGEEYGAFAIWCLVENTKMGDMYFSGMLIHYGCKQNPKKD